MGYQRSKHPKMTLYASGGERKYLNATERQRFYVAIDDVLACPQERAFCKLIYWTGCRPSEALKVTLRNVVVEDCYVVFCSLKKRGDKKGNHYRAVPVPPEFSEELDRVFGLSAAQAEGGPMAEALLFKFSRTTGWVRMTQVMNAARLNGARACARGLRHSFGASLILAKVPVTSVQLWMGHEDISTTMIYLQLDITDNRAIAARMWAMHQSYTAQTTETLNHEMGGHSPITLSSKDEVSGTEIIRLISAYCAISAKEPRLEFLNAVEARAQSQIRGVDAQR